MEKHNLDRLFSDKLEEAQVEPKAASWDQIEEALNTKGRKLSWTWASIAASAMLVFVSSWYLLNSSQVVETAEYDYAELNGDIASLPVQFIYVPIYIFSANQDEPVKTNPKTNNIKKEQVQLAMTDSPSSNDSFLTLASDEIITEESGIIVLEEAPFIIEEEIIMASIEDPLDDESESLKKPITIIYKQGEPAKESNFTKAISYMEDVRMGDKKLVNFEKLRENFRSKFKSSEEVDTE